MNRSLLALSLLALLAAPAAAEPSPAPAQDLEISAKSTTYDGRAHTYTVKGDVHITLPQLAVTCDQATIYADASEKHVVKIVFTGGVEAKRGTDSFRADTITLLVPERRLVAEGTTHVRLRLPEKASGPITGP
jgi:lipopolysaccharide export system protein LptA